MSLPKKITVHCEKCGAPIQATVFDSVNTDYSENIAEEIISGKLFCAECGSCGFENRLEYNLLYHDIKHNAMIWVLHNEAEGYSDLVKDARSTNLPNYKTTRIVDDINALCEKVACLEHGRDDRVIELCKVFALYSLVKQQPNLKISSAFYSADGGKELLLFYDVDGDCHTCELTDDTYTYVGGLYFNSSFANEFDYNYPIVDYSWAEPIFYSLLKAETETIKKQQEPKAEAVNSSEPQPKNNFCRKCGAKLPEDSNFCDKCGTKIFPLTPPKSIAVNLPSTTSSLSARSDLEKLRRLNLQINSSLPGEKHNLSAEAEEVKKSRRKKIFFISFAAVMAIFSIFTIISYKSDSKSRKFDPNNTSTSYTNVYANVTYLEPEYYIYETINSSRVIKEVICSSKTTDGVRIWVMIEVSMYPGASPYLESSLRDYYYGTTWPLQLKGGVTRASDFKNSLADKIGDVYILNVNEMKRLKN